MAKIIIDKDKISALNPCADRFDNYVEHYKSRKFTKDQFLRLKKIKHSDKLWVAFRMMKKENISKAAGEIAKSVLFIYETAYPGDLRPRQAVEAALSGDAAAAFAAAFAAYAAYAAAFAANAANAADRKAQEALQLKIISKYWR